MSLSEKRKGEAFLWAEILIFGLFPVVTTLTYASVPPIVSFLWSTFFASTFFAFVLTVRGRWNELRQPQLWKYSLVIAVLIGVLFYGCYFLGLQSTTPGNAALMALFEVCTTFVFFSFMRNERPTIPHTLGAVCMVAGALVILLPNFSGFRAGDVLVLAGTLFTPAGNYLQQKARQFASSESIMFLRTVLSLPFIIALAFVLRTSLNAGTIAPVFFLLALNGIVLLGVSKLFWIEAIHRMNVPKGTALQAIDVLVTLFFAWLILSQTPTAAQLLSLPLFLVGVLLLTDQFHLSFKQR